MGGVEREGRGALRSHARHLPHMPGRYRDFIEPSVAHGGDPAAHMFDVDSDYCLSLRGKGNYSFRLYEIFAMGRIPLFIDTDCVLPFEDEIDWKRHCCWVDQSDLGRADEIVAQFHATGIGAEQKPFPITDLAEAAQSIGWHRCGVERLENDDMTVFVVAQEFFIFSVEP